MPTPPPTTPFTTAPITPIDPTARVSEIESTGAARVAGRGASGLAYEYLADLFLREGGSSEGKSDAVVAAGLDGRGASQGAPASTVTEKRGVVLGLVVGHLPVLAAPWVTQFARHMAMRRREACGLVRVRAGQISVELVGGEPTGAKSPTLGESLAALIEQTRCVLVRVDEPMEMRLALHPGIDRVTLLTGADEAAVIASYRTLKVMRSELGPDGVMPAVTVAILGSPGEKAREAGARLRAAAKSFLRTPIELEVCEQRLGGAPSVELYRGEVRGEPGEVIGEAIVAIQRAYAKRHAKAASATSQGVSVVLPTPRHAAAATAHATKPVASMPAPVALPMPEGASINARLSTTTRAEAREPLATRIPGVRALRARCPVVTREVELGVDDRGGLHLVIGASASWEIDGAIAALSAARAWAGINRSVLMLTPDEHGQASRLEMYSATTLHLLVPAGTDVRRLLDGEVRVHLTAPASGYAGVCVAVN